MKPFERITISGFKSFWSGLRPATNRDLERMEKQIMAKLSELNDTLKAIGDKLDKAKTEIVNEIATLKSGLGDAEIPADAQASLDRLTALAQGLDDLNPDAPAATT